MSYMEVSTGMETVEERVAGIRGAIAHNVRYSRRAREWTQEQLAERAGVSRATIAKIETSEGDVNLSVISRLAWAFGDLTLNLLAPSPSGYREWTDEETLDAIGAKHLKELEAKRREMARAWDRF